jgi:hypothetical protein
MEQENADPVAFSGQCKVVSEARTVVTAIRALKVNANVARKLALLVAIRFLNQSCQSFRSVAINSWPSALGVGPLG